MRFTFRTKPLTGYAAGLVLTCVVGVLGWRSSANLTAEFERLYQDSVMGAVHLSAVESAMWELRFALPQFFLQGEDVRAKLLADQPKWTKQVEENIKAYARTTRSPEEQEALKEWEETSARYFEKRPRYFELVTAGKMQEAVEYRTRYTNPPAAAVKALVRLINLQQKVAADRQQQVAAAS
jgi:methyl-accepting chemotaxis protein